MNATTIQKSGFPHLASQVVYIIVCLGISAVFIIPLLILVAFNYRPKPVAFAPRKPIVNNPPLYSLRLKI